MDEIKKKIAELLDQFFFEEKGNRLSQFSFLALKQIILKELDKPPEEVKDGSNVS